MGVSTVKKFVFVGLSVLCWSVMLLARAQVQGQVPVPVTAQVQVQVPAPAPGQETAPVATSTTGAESPSRIYIPVGDPNFKKVLIAIEPTIGESSFANSFFATMTSDMEFTDLFEILPPSKLPVSRGGMVPGSFRFEPYRVLGVEFLIKSSVSFDKGRYQAEVRLFDVTKGVQILGRLYPLIGKVATPGRELAHYAGNDIIEALTGEPGIFRTRILMSCGQRTKEIYVMDFDGANVTALTRDGNFALSPSWAPDGKRILFTSYREWGTKGALNPNLYMYDLSTHQRTVVSATKGLNTGGVFHPFQEKIAYTHSQNGRPEIYILDLIKKTRFPITKTLFFSVEPDWSPDGNRLVFSSSKTGRPHIWVSNADGSASRRLTFAGVYNSSPNWSPKGDKIVFAGQDNDGNNFNIFTIDPNGSNLQRLTSDSFSNENPVYSPDARFIAYSSNESGVYQIKVMTARGTRSKTLTPKSLGPCKQPRWSPRL
jgi:TolB protein